MLDLTKLKEHLETPEAQARMTEYVKRLFNRKEIEHSQLTRAQNYDDRFEELVEKINEKYGSDAYKERWYKRGIEPPEHLTYFVLEYVSTRGESLHHDELEKYAGMFTARIYKYKGYIIELCVGQGSFVAIYKQ